MDCYFHGYFSGPNCPYCDKEERENKERGSLQPDDDERKANFDQADENSVPKPKDKKKKN